MTGGFVFFLPVITLAVQVVAWLFAVRLILVSRNRGGWCIFAVVVTLMCLHSVWLVFGGGVGAGDIPALVRVGELAIAVLIVLVLFLVGGVLRTADSWQLLGDYRQMVDEVSQGVWLLDNQAKTLFVNRFMANMLGYTEAQMLARPIFYFMDSEGRIEAERYFKQQRLGGPEQSDLRFRKKDGSDLWTLFCSNQLRGDSGRLLGVIAMVTDIGGRKEAEQKVLFNAQCDTLTGLPGRSLLLDRLSQALARGKRYRKMVAVLFIDLDKFKPINDTLGHDAGDTALKVVASRLRSRVREVDTVARFGGDEFVVVLQDLEDTSEVPHLAQTFRDMLCLPILLDGGKSCVVGASVGVSIFPEHGEDGDVLLQKADEAMYLAKQGGCEKICFVGDVAKSASETEADIKMH